MGAWGNDAAVCRGGFRGDGPARTSLPLAARHDPRSRASRPKAIPPRGRRARGLRDGRDAPPRAVSSHGQEPFPTHQSPASGAGSSAARPRSRARVGCDSVAPWPGGTSGLSRCGPRCGSCPRRRASPVRPRRPRRRPRRPRPRRMRGCPRRPRARSCPASPTGARNGSSATPTRRSRRARRSRPARTTRRARPSRSASRGSSAAARRSRAPRRSSKAAARANL